MMAPKSYTKTLSEAYNDITNLHNPPDNPYNAIVTPTNGQPTQSQLQISQLFHNENNPDLEATEVINFNTTSLPNGIHDKSNNNRQSLQSIDQQVL